MTAIIDYRAGNLTSVRLAFAAIGEETVVTSDPDVIRRAERVVFPGVGAARSAMENLRSMGLEAAVREAAATRPFLGICLGMQILFEHSEEDGGTDLLAIIPGKVRRFPDTEGCKIPQIGWNQVNGGTDYYFVHSYYAERGEYTVGVTDYADVRFTSMVRKGNILACQFHPEKSGRAGLALLRKWLAGETAFGNANEQDACPATLTRRVIPCLDVRGGRVTKGVKFQNNIDLGDPVEMAVGYSDGGADELVFYDITASAERRPIDIGMVEAVAKAIRIPFAVGGGISSVADMERVILAGAEKISVNSRMRRVPAATR